MISKCRICHLRDLLKSFAWVACPRPRGHVFASPSLPPSLDLQRVGITAVPLCRNWYLAPDTTLDRTTQQAEDFSVHPVLTGSEAMEAEAESKEKETLLILPTPLSIPIFDLHWIATLLALPIPPPLPSLV